MLAEWLVHEGDLVDAGDPIARLYPEVLRMTAIQLTTGRPGARILGFGGYRPRRRVTNDELAQVMETNDEWIQSRVGIAERRWAADDETLVEMAVAAGGKALAASGLAPDEIDLVVLASASLPQPDPRHRPAGRPPAGHPAAGRLRPQRRLRGVLLRARRWRRNAIRVGLRAQRPGRSAVERLTDVTDMSDRATAVIFADGAGAAVVGACRRAGHRPGRLGQRRRPALRDRDRRRQPAA